MLQSNQRGRTGCPYHGSVCVCIIETYEILFSLGVSVLVCDIGVCFSGGVSTVENKFLCIKSRADNKNPVKPLYISCIMSDNF